MIVIKISSLTVLLVLAFVSFFAFSKAADINCDILQYKLDRLYFPVGTEENVYPANHFAVYMDGDSIYGGYIEASFTGISYSSITHYFFDTISIDSCRGLIKPADIDSTSDIVIGIPSSIPPGNIIRLPDIYSVDGIPFVSPPLMAQNGNRLILEQYESEIEMILDFESGRIDGFFSHSKVNTAKMNARTISNLLPFFAAIIPNISQPINEDGLLPTSLYHRFDKKRMSLFFNGDDIRPFNCFYPINEFSHSESGFDPKKAQGLLRQLDRFPKSVQIFVGDKRLKKLGRYYADVLNRDRIKTVLTIDRSNSDIYLIFIPTLASKIDSSLFYIHNILVNDTITGGKVNALTDIIADCLELSRLTNSPEAKEYYIGRILQNLKNDFGAYPLFQPTIFFTADRHLRGFGFDPDRFFNLLALTRIQLSEISLEKK